MPNETPEVIEAYKAFIGSKAFPCIAARAALASDHIKCMVAGNITCSEDDTDILNFLYHFVDDYRNSQNSFHSAAIIFKEPQQTTEEIFDQFLWQRLQSITNLDAKNYGWDRRVSADPLSPNFSFSIKKEAFF